MTGGFVDIRIIKHAADCFSVEQRVGDEWWVLAEFLSEAEAKKFWLDEAQAPAPEDRTQ